MEDRCHNYHYPSSQLQDLALAVRQEDTHLLAVNGRGTDGVEEG